MSRIQLEWICKSQYIWILHCFKLRSKWLTKNRLANNVKKLHLQEICLNQFQAICLTPNNNKANEYDKAIDWQEQNRSYQYGLIYSVLSFSLRCMPEYMRWFCFNMPLQTYSNEIYPQLSLVKILASLAHVAPTASAVRLTNRLSAHVSPPTLDLHPVVDRNVSPVLSALQTGHASIKNA